MMSKRVSLLPDPIIDKFCLPVLMESTLARRRPLMTAIVVQTAWPAMAPTVTPYTFYTHTHGRP